MDALLYFIVDVALFFGLLLGLFLFCYFLDLIEKIKKYLENPPASPYIETFVAYSKRYLEDKPNQKQLMADIDRLMEVEFKK